MQEVKDCIEEGFVPHAPDTWKWRYGELKEAVKMEYYEGFWREGSPVMRSVQVPKGATVKIVMASRFGDVGITEDLNLLRGYGTRVTLGMLENLRKEQ